MAPTKRKQTPPPTSTTVRRSSRRTATATATATAPPPSPSSSAAAPKKKKAKITSEEVKPVSEKNVSGKTIVIEHCKQCNAFKTRAFQVKEGLEKGVDGVNVLVNPEKPRRGCFEIREECGEVYVSLLEMKRPFQKMKDLDMDKVVSEIVEKLNCK